MTVRRTTCLIVARDDDGGIRARSAASGASHRTQPNSASATLRLRPPANTVHECRRLVGRQIGDQLNSLRNRNGIGHLAVVDLEDRDAKRAAIHRGIRAKVQPGARQALIRASISSAWAATPRTSSVVYSRTGGFAASVRSARVVRGSNPRSSASNKMSSARFARLATGRAAAHDQLTDAAQVVRRSWCRP